MTMRTIAIAAGGTGGHVFPALSLARTLADRGHAVHVLTDRRGSAFEIGNDAWPVHRIRAASPSQPGLVSRLGALVQLGLGVFDARRILRRFAIEAVIGFGGYPSVPAVIGSSTLRLPTVLHEQNAVLGRANRWLARRVDIIATSFDGTRGMTGLGVEVERTGNPVREAITDRRDMVYGPPTVDTMISLCVFGGSLGARILSDVVPAAVALLPPALRQRLQITQQCRSEDQARVEAAYEDFGQSVEIGTFFDDVPEQLAAAHLVICRAGASTVAELAVIGRPAILIPYPHAMDDHQTANAAAFEAAGGGWHIDEDGLTTEALADRIAGLLGDPERLMCAAQAARGFGIPDASGRLADLALRVAAGQGDGGKEARR